MDQMKVAVCNCGDCTHWEVLRRCGGEVILLCKTCSKTVELGTVKEDIHDHVAWVHVNKDKLSANVQS